MAISKYEIIQMFNRNNHYTRETIQDINELIEDIDTNPKKFTYELSEEIEQFAEKLKLCPLCGANIVQIGRDEQFSEYSGQPVSEQINKYGCDECNYIVS